MSCYEAIGVLIGGNDVLLLCMRWMGDDDAMMLLFVPEMCCSSSISPANCSIRAIFIAPLAKGAGNLSHRIILACWKNCLKMCAIGD